MTPEEQNVETGKKVVEYLRQIAAQLAKIAKNTAPGLHDVTPPDGIEHS